MCIRDRVSTQSTGLARPMRWWLWLAWVLGHLGAAAGHEYTLQFSAGGVHALQLLFMGNDAQPPGWDLETLVGTVPAGGTNLQNSHFGDRFVVRNNDNSFRFKVTVYSNTGHSLESDYAKYPYQIRFRNIMWDQAPSPIELQYGQEHVMIPNGEAEWHLTDANSPFDVRDSAGNLMASIKVHPIGQARDEL
eukprot:TRINITY_DN19730_c0_g1_i3.p1 TRINITY_DN19730_c0_g1~~TRINITY_DN19730_c0_g1_i3.p1  ORF type:complete len:191 (+),score=52.51 TRINITY_DN19730_c0_g1_i3:199-771(+)